MEKEATQMLGIDKRKVRVIHNGILPPQIYGKGQEIRNKWGINKDEKLVGTVARLIPSKGIDTLIEAAPLVMSHYPHIKFMVVGDGPQESFF